MTPDKVKAVAARMGHTLSDAEIKAVVTVTNYGSQFGYGNLMTWLGTAWAAFLVAEYGMTADQARAGAFDLAYPIPGTTEMGA